jgi:hypothetical protein
MKTNQNESEEKKERKGKSEPEEREREIKVAMSPKRRKANPGNNSDITNAIRRVVEKCKREGDKDNEMR